METIPASWSRAWSYLKDYGFDWTSGGNPEGFARTKYSLRLAQLVQPAGGTRAAAWPGGVDVPIAPTVRIELPDAAAVIGGG